jgi:hypothetical protein
MKILGVLNVPVIAGDAGSPANGDVWYNSSTGKFRKRQNGVTEDMDTTGASSEILSNNKSPVNDVTITAGYSVYVSDFLECADTKTIEAGALATIEVG